MSAEYLSTVEAARILGKCRQTIRMWCDSGKLESVKDDDGTYRIPARQVEKLSRKYVRNPGPNRRLLSPSEAAGMLGYSESHVRELCLQRRIAHLPGPPLRIDVRDVEAFIERSKIPAITPGRI